MNGEYTHLHTCTCILYRGGSRIGETGVCKREAPPLGGSGDSGAYFTTV